MSARIRQLYAVFVIMLSVIGLLWLLLYSAGYGFDWKTLRLQATGALRITVEADQPVFITLLPAGGQSTKDRTSFVHLLPGMYQLTVTADGYQPFQDSLQVEENHTTILDPLRLWPDEAVVQGSSQADPLPHTNMDELPIAVQQALAQLEQIDISTVELLDDTTLLIAGRYEISVMDTESLSTLTYTRISSPILAVAGMNDEPYVAYVTGNELHVIDTRIATHYRDQVIAAVPDGVTNLVYNRKGERFELVTTDGKLYYYFVRSDR